MTKTENLGLNLTEDENTKFADWRKSIDGNNSEGEESNMQIIDKAIGEIDEKVSNIPKGEDGKSAYEIWLTQDGNDGKSVSDFIASLKGEKGEKGQDGTVSFDELTEEQKAQLKGDSCLLNDKIVSIAVNLFNVNTISEKGNWCDTSNGKFETLATNPYVGNYRISEFIEVKPNTSYTYSNSTQYSTFYGYVLFDENKQFISGASPNIPWNRLPMTITTPSNAKYIVLNFNNEFYAKTQFEEGETATEYQPYSNDYYLNGLRVKSSQVEQSAKGSILKLPKQFDLVVGDTFELFYKGVMLCKDPYSYYIKCRCSIGKPFSKKFIVTPTTAGTYPLSIALFNDQGAIIDDGTVNLVVKGKMASPTEQVNVLCIGDSLTAPGSWVGEFYRRLTSTDKYTAYNKVAMAGDGLLNISFVGKTSTGVSLGAKFEGFGGWTFDNYLSTASSTSNYWVTATHSKTDNDQESIYADENGVQWQLETIESRRLKFKKYSGSGSLSLNGTLNWVSGGVDTSAISYTNAELEEGNPFVYNSVVDFGAYCSDLGIDTIDQCYILLGWNTAMDGENRNKDSAKRFIDKLIAFNSNIKIVLMGLQIPSLDGLANNYGASNETYSNYRVLQEYVFNLNKWYQDIADEYPNNVSFVNIAGQFDTENNMITMDTKVNERNEEVVKLQSNGVHPAETGYMQIADAAYRKFNSDNQ